MAAQARCTGLATELCLTERIDDTGKFVTQRSRHGFPGDDSNIKQAPNLNWFLPVLQWH